MYLIFRKSYLHTIRPCSWNGAFCSTISGCSLDKIIFKFNVRLCGLSKTIYAI
uniref:Uncharacterized protein n=1 Tax=Anguilla anguilla TaxID=7936 RepID=A0A0E9VYL7_ANGAN